MRINEEARTLDIEARDINYVLGAYVRLYLYQTKNTDPERIFFPMFRSVPHPYKKGVTIPIEFVPDDSPVAIEIKYDGSNVAEPTPESEAKADEAERQYDNTKKTLEQLKTDTEPPVPPDKSEIEPKISAARAAFATQQEDILKNRIAKEPPGGAIPPGQATDYGSRRDAADQQIVKKAMVRDKDISADEEAEEKPAG